MSPSPNLSEILLVEDDDDHAELVTYILNEMTPNTRLSRCADGAKAVEHLDACGRTGGPKVPDLVLLDLKLPLLDGIEVAERTKANAELRHLPIVMLTTSDAQSDRARAYQAGVNSYLVKPMEFAVLREILSDVLHYWGSVNRPLRHSSEG